MHGYFPFDKSESLLTSLDKVSRWVEQRDYKGYDPGDGLTSWLRPLTCGNLFAERVLQQVIWKSPWNVRPMVGVRPMDSTKGRGFMAWGYLLRFKQSGDAAFRGKAVACLDWLMAHKTPKYPEFCCCLLVQQKAEETLSILDSRAHLIVVQKLFQ